MLHLRAALRNGQSSLSMTSRQASYNVFLFLRGNKKKIWREEPRVFLIWR